MKLSVILITKNEGHNIWDCLNTVSFASEWIVVDSGSTDDTVLLAKEFGATVIQTDNWPGFGIQKNRALSAATGDWILSIDADERITPELAEEIKKTVQSPDAFDAYEIQRYSWYCGKFIRYGDWSKDYVLRLFKRHHAQFTNDLVHERLVATGKIGRLKKSMKHYSYTNFSQVLQKIDSYTEYSAIQKHRQGKKAGVGTALLHGLWAFIRGYILRLGFLDGSHGLALAISNAENSYYRYLKIWQLEQTNIPSSNKRP